MLLLEPQHLDCLKYKTLQAEHLETPRNNLMFFEKGKPTREVWYYEHRLPEGQKSYSKTKTIRLEELNPIKEWWNNRLESDVAWKVNIKTIVERGYDLDIKNPSRQEEVHEYGSVELLEMLRVSFEKSAGLLNQIKENLNSW